MKKFGLVVLLLLILFSAQAQRGKRGSSSTIKWFSLAVKAGYGNSVFLNTEIKNDKNVVFEYFTPSYFYGGRFGFTYGEFVGISFEYLNSAFGQKYEPQLPTPYTKEIKLKSTDMLVLFRYTNEFGFYLELGPKFSTLKSADITSTSASVVIPTNPKEKFADKFTSVVFGLGFMPYRGERVTLSLGVRGSYATNTIMANESYFLLNDPGGYSLGTYTNNKTNPLTLQVALELNYFFGFFGDATCGRGRLMFFQ